MAGDPERTRLVHANQCIGLANSRNSGLDIAGEFPGLANPPDPGENENPGALAGATGAQSRGPIFKSEEYRTRYLAARRLCRAIADCHEEDAVLILEAALADLTAGQPQPAFLGFMAEAGFWADMASVSELKAYAVACFTRLSAQDQAAFLAYLSGRAAHAA